MLARSTLAGLAVIAGYVSVFAVNRMTDADLPVPMILAGGDLTDYCLPAFDFIRQALLDGELPLWNPYQLVGVPFIALHLPSALYPPTLALTLLPSNIAITVHVLLHAFAAGAFTFLFARRIGLAAPSASIAALAFVGSGPIVEAIHSPPFLATYAWLPAMLLAVEKLLQQPGRRNALYLSAALAMGFLAGFSQAFVYSVIVTALYAALRLATCLSWRLATRCVLWALAAGVLAIGLISVQLLPTLEYAGDATRSFSGLSFEQASRSTHTWSTLTRGMLGLTGSASSLPFIFLPLVLVGLITQGTRSRALIFGGLGLLLLDFMCGANGWTFPVYFGLPGGNLFRFPSRIDFAYHLMAALALAVGSEAVLAHARRIDRRGAALATGTVLLLLVGTDVYLRNPLLYQFLPVTDPERAHGHKDLQGFLQSRPMHTRFFAEPSASSWIPPKLGMLSRVLMVPEYEPQLPRAYAAYFGIPTDRPWHGGLDLPGSEPDPTGRARFEIPDLRLLDLLSVEYYIAGRRDGRALEKLKKITGGFRASASGKAPIVRRQEALPRAYVVGRVIDAGTPAEALHRVRSPAFDPSVSAVIEGARGRLVAASASRVGEAQIDRARRNRVDLTAGCLRECLLVLTDLYDRNWRATVDGEPARIERTNYLVRGIFLGPGRHQIVFQYAPRSLLIGAAITVVSMLGWILATAATWWRGAPRGRST